LALQESETRKRAIVETALDAVITIDQDGKIVEFNESAEGIFGYNRTDVVGKAMVELIIPPSLREAHRQAFGRYLETRQSALLGKRIELVAMRRDGSEFPIEIAIRPIETSSRLMFTAFIRDISARKRGEAMLQQGFNELQLQQEIGLVILAADDPRAVLDRVLGLCVPACGFDLGAILLTEPNGDIVEVAATFGFAESADIKGASHGGMGGAMARLRGPSILRNIEEDPSLIMLKNERLDACFSCRSAPAIKPSDFCSLPVAVTKRSPRGKSTWRRVSVIKSVSRFKNLCWRFITRNSTRQAWPKPRSWRALKKLPKPQPRLKATSWRI
jgi:PAS domain S-box-containing protein